MSRAVGVQDARASTTFFSAAPSSAAPTRRCAAMALVLVLGATALPAAAQQPQVVRATNAPVWGPAPRLVEEVRIGTMDGADDPRERHGEVWIRLSAGGEVLDWLPIPEEPSTPPSFVLSTASGYDRPFTRQLVTTLSPLGYLVVGHNRTYAFELRRTEEPALRIERPFTPLPVRGPEHAEWEAWAEFFARAGSGDRSYSVPDTKPAFSTLRTDAGGRIWVRRYVEAVHRPRTGPPPASGAPPHEWREQPTWNVFEPTGTFLGTVVLPANAYFYDVVDRDVWATVRGEFDEAYVVRFRIQPGDR